VILPDLVLPRRSGQNAIPELLKESPSANTLVVWSQTRLTAIRQAIAAGAHGYIPNRASATELVDAILRVASGDQYADPDLGAQLAVNRIW
jgi:DNA-binding NarL/FixJ family response regulator